VARDSAIIGLAALLDPIALAAELEHATHAAALEAGSITYLKYKPGQSCLAAHRLVLPGGTVDVYAKAYRANAGGKLDPSRLRNAIGGPLGPGAFLLESLRTVVRVFPNDAKVGALAHLFGEPARARRLLADLLPAERAAAMEAAPLTTLRYKPERRYVARHAGGAAVVRAYDAAGHVAALQSSNAFRSRGALRVARRIGSSDACRALAFEWLPGNPLDALLGDAISVEAASTSTGAALAELHAQEPGRLPTRTREDDAASLLSLARWLSALWPPLRARVTPIAWRLASALREAKFESTPIHGDFYAAQVLVDGETAALLDLDESVSADPATDLGNFLAHLDASVLSGRLSPSRRDEAAPAFLRGYGMTRRALPAHIRLHHAASLLRLAPRPFRERRPDWPVEIDSLLGVTEALLDAAEREAVA
jgi:aminoglycoside phosphotransferase (APT) family kinase protein